MLKSRHRTNFNGGKSKYKNSPLAPFVRCNKCGYKIRFGKSSNGKDLIGINLYCYYCRMLGQEEKLPHYKELEKDIFENLKDRFHTDKAEKERLLKEQKKNYMIRMMNFQRRKELNLKTISLVRFQEKPL